MWPPDEADIANQLPRCLRFYPHDSRDGGGFFEELAADRLRDGLARVDHAARQRPLARVAPLDRDELELVRPRRVVPRDDRVGRVVGPPLAEQPAPAHAGAAARVERETH